MSDCTRVLVVEDSDADFQHMKAAIAEVQGPQIELCHSSRLADAVSWLARERFDAVLLDLSLPDSQGLNTVAQVRRAAPSVPLLALTGLDDEALAVSALKQGAQDYLLKWEFDGNRLVRAIRFGLARSEAQANKLDAPTGTAAPRLIGLLGGKGGCGSTTVACHLAAELGRLTGSRSLLADFDLACGAIRFLLGVGSAYDLSHAADNIDGLDLALWQKIVSGSHPDMDILASPGLGGGRVAPRRDRLGRLLQFARLNYGFSVVDLGRGLPELSAGLIHHFDEVLLVATPDLVALSHARGIIESLSASGHSMESCRFTLNRIPRRLSLTLEEIERVVKSPVHTKLPDCPEELHGFSASGKLAARDTRFGAGIAEMARRLAGLGEPALKRRRIPLLSRSSRGQEVLGG